MKTIELLGKEIIPELDKLGIKTEAQVVPKQPSASDVASNIID
jgi:hypothetical protein